MEQPNLFLGPQIFGPSAASASKSAFHTGWNPITVANLQIIWREKSAESVYWTAPRHESLCSVIKMSEMNSNNI